MARPFGIFTAVVVALLAAIVISCRVRILLGRAVFDTYPMTDPVAEKILRRNDEREQIAKAEKQFALLALFALPIGCLLARSKSNAGRRG